MAAEAVPTKPDVFPAGPSQGPSAKPGPQVLSLFSGKAAAQHHGSVTAEGGRKSVRDSPLLE